MSKEKTYSAREAAMLYGVAERTIVRHIAAGNLEGFQRLRKWIIKEVDLFNWAKSNNLEPIVQ